MSKFISSRQYLPKGDNTVTIQKYLLSHIDQPTTDQPTEAQEEPTVQPTVEPTVQPIVRRTAPTVQPVKGPFNLDTFTRSTTATRLGLTNTPTTEHQTNLQATIDFANGLNDA